MKKIIPFVLFLPLILFSIYLGFTQLKSRTQTNSNKGNFVPSPTIIIPTSAEVITSVPTSINLHITSPESGVQVDSTSIVVLGTTEKNIHVAINDQDLISNTDGSFKTSVLLDEGENYISIVAYDEGGNTTEREIMVTRLISGL